MFKPSVRGRGMSGLAARQQPAPKKDRAQRESVVKSASVNLDGGDQTYSCTIRDISRTGAKVSVANASTINNRILLLCRGSDLIALADVVWRSQNEIGVHFIRQGTFAQEQEFRAKQAATYAAQMEAATRQQQQAQPQSAFIAQQAAISMNTHFEAMGLDPTLDYTPDQLKHKFRLLAMRAHPDQGGDAEVFQRLQVAFDTLTQHAMQQTA